MILTNFSFWPDSPNLLAFQGAPLILSFPLWAILTNLPFFARFPRGPSCLLICIGLQVVGDFDQFAIFARFTGFPRESYCLLICIGLQVVGDFDQGLPFLADSPNLPNSPAFQGGPLLHFFIGFQVVVGEILPFLPFLLLCAFLDISDTPGFSGVTWVIKKYRKGTLEDIIKTNQTVEIQTRKAVQMHYLARNFHIPIERESGKGNTNRVCHYLSL